MRKRIIISQYSALQINRLLTALIVAMLMFLPVSVSAEDEPPTILITGANASHGLAFAEEYAALGWNVIATCRTPAKADRLNALAEKFPNVVVEELDIVDVDEG